MVFQALADGSTRSARVIVWLIKVAVVRRRSHGSEPDICDHLKQLKTAASRMSLVAPIGFVSDHIEVLYDLDYEAKEVATSTWDKDEIARTPRALIQRS